MVRFLARRVLLAALVLFIISIIVFLLFYVGSGPDAVAHRLAGKNATAQTIGLVKKRLGLDQPLYIQYWHFLWGSSQQAGLLKGSFGYSFQNQASVNETIKQAFPITLSLAIGSAVLWLFMGLMSGVLSAVRPRTFLDRMFTSIALFFYSFPTFVLGSVLLLTAFYYLTKYAHLQWFPASGYVPITQSPGQWARHLILPWFTLAAVTAAAYTRLTRGSMLDVLGEDYIRTARAKGLPERRVIFRHGLRAALTPIVTQFGIDLGTLLGGAIITETVFSLPGLGYTAVHGIINQDLPVILGITMLAAAAIVVANILVDIIYAVLDPRVRLN